MAADIHGAGERGTKSGSDFRAPGLATAPLAGWGARARMVSLVARGCPCPVPDTPRRSPDRTYPRGLHPRHIFLSPSFSSFSFFLLPLSSLCSLLLSSVLLFSLPFLPLLHPLLTSQSVFLLLLHFPPLYFFLQTCINYTFSISPSMSLWQDTDAIHLALPLTFAHEMSL